MTVGLLHFDDIDFTALYTGCDFNASLTWTDGAGNPIDLSTYTADMQVRKKVGGDIVVEYSTGNGKIVMTSLGVITITDPHASTSLYIPGNYVYDFILTDNTGKRSPFIKGSFVIFPTVTV